MIRLALIFLLLALPAGAQTTNVIVSAEVIGNSNIIHWRTVTCPGAAKLVIVQRTNEPARLTRWFLEGDASGTIETSTDLVHWTNVPVRWTCSTPIATDAPQRYYRVSRAPDLNPQLKATR